MPEDVKEVSKATEETVGTARITPPLSIYLSFRGRTEANLTGCGRLVRHPAMLWYCWPMESSRQVLPPLVCPLTKLPLHPCPADLLSELNQKIARRELISSAGELIVEPLEAALVRADGKVVYPIQRGIPIVIPEAGISVSDA